MKTNEEVKEALLDLAEKAVEELVGHRSHRRPKRGGSGSVGANGVQSDHGVWANSPGGTPQAESS